MSKYVIIASRQPPLSNTFLDDFEGFLRTLKPEIRIERISYDGCQVPQNDLMFVEPFLPRHVFARTARDFSRKGLVFVVEQGLSCSVGDLMQGVELPGLDYPVDPHTLRRGIYSGLAGVVYRLEGADFEAFTVNAIGKAKEVLAPYL